MKGWHILTLLSAVGYHSILRGLSFKVAGLNFINWQTRTIVCDSFTIKEDFRNLCKNGILEEKKIYLKKKRKKDIFKEIEDRKTYWWNTAAFFLKIFVLHRNILNKDEIPLLLAKWKQLNCGWIYFYCHKRSYHVWPWILWLRRKSAG